MAASPVENTTEPGTSEEETKMEDFQDAVTVHTGETTTLTGAEWRESHILLEITYKDQTEGRTSPQKHMLVLKALGNAFDATELEIYDNKNRQLSLELCKAMTKIEHYEDRFKLYQGNGRHYVIFRISSTIRFQGVKREPEVLRTLKKIGCYMKRHHWAQDQWDIVTLGFLTELDPGRHLADEMREHILALAKAKDCSTTPGSRFKLVPQRFKVKYNGSFCSADAYGVQCMRIDAQSVDQLMKNTYRETLGYVKNRMRKDKPRSYMNALRLQNKYITNVKTIPIVGITKITMADVRPLLLGHEHIQHVAATRKSDTIGRWDILTNDEHQETVRTFIETNLNQFLADATEDPAKPQDFPPPGIATRGTNANDDNSQGEMSYLSSSAGSYDSLMENDNDVQYDAPPTQRVRNAVSVSGFSWAQVAARSTNAPASRVSHVSDLTGTTQATQAASVEITELKSEVTDLKSQLQSLVLLITTLTDRLTPVNHPPPQYYPPPHAYNRLYHPGQNLSQQQRQEEQYTHTTPPRHNGTTGRGHGGRHNGGRHAQDPRGRAIRPAGAQKRDVPASPPHLTRHDPKETPTKRSNTNSTPTRRNDPTEERRMTVTNPYAQNRPIQEHHGPQPFDHRQSMGDINGRPHGMDEYGHYADGRHDALIYSASQQPGAPGQFSYTPPSQEDTHMTMQEHQGDPNDQYPDHEEMNMQIQEHSGQSHPAEDAMQFTRV